ncbi:MAG: 3-deoxy-manno-octulosonate cytidylyltransferase [Mediterranea sp.]|jgi:3-deoxy-manno-octulosonate cytidylyltransferase (CMP-KDO synthetase)|nr:3-deoxy-manno-octulosonate cytidylyltransferase [Mediterranea sp.]
MKFVGIIPARYASTRFPGKPLATLGGKSVIQRVYEQASQALEQVYVATDDERIQAAVEAFGGKVVMTSSNHRSGTDRCQEAIGKIGGGFDVVINIQGDEPFVQASQLESLMACFDNERMTEIATLVKPFPANATWDELENPNTPKVIVSQEGLALCFSRSVIPYRRGVDKQAWAQGHTYYKHIGLYAYRVEILEEITALPQSSLELAESLEQLRWLENGFLIAVGVTDVDTIGIDTPEDLKRAEEFLKKGKG